MTRRERNQSRKGTKRALTSSILAIALCVVLLAGATFAWFTDTASTKISEIKSGTLKIDVTDADGTTVKDTTLTWQKAAGGENEEVLWEPGATYKLKELTIKNTGTLALKYNIHAAGINGDDKLNEAIDWTIQTSSVDDEGATAYTDTDLGTFVGHLKAGETQNLTISGTMKTSAGNEYQGLSIEGAAITIYATQDTVEYDSIGNTYDEGAKLPTVAADAAEVDTMLESAKSSTAVIALPADMEYDLTSGALNNTNGTNVTFVGDGTQTVDVITKAVSAEGGMLSYQRGASFTFENLTIEAGEGNFDGIVCDELTFINCTITGKLTLFSKATFTNCTFENTMSDQYSIWTWGGTDVKFDGCTFNTNGKAILLYGNGPTTLTVNNCIFTDRNGGSAGKAAIEVGDDYNATYVLNASNNTIYGYAINSNGTNTSTKMYGNKNSMDGEHLIVTLSNNTCNDGAATAVSTAAQLKGAFTSMQGQSASTTVILTKDIDMTGYTAYNADYKTITIYGNGHTLKNQTAPLFDECGIGTITIKDVTFKDANINVSKINAGASAVIGYFNNNGGGTINIEGCKIVDSTITATHGFAAGFIGGISKNAGSVSITDCSVTGSTITGTDGVGGLVGTNYTSLTIDKVNVTGNTIKNNYAANDQNGGWSAGALVGTNIGGGVVAATDVTVSGNTISDTSSNYNKDAGDYGYLFLGDGTYTVNGTAISNS